MNHQKIHFPDQLKVKDKREKNQKPIKLKALHQKNV